MGGSHPRSTEIGVAVEKHTNERAIRACFVFFNSRVREVQSEREVRMMHIFASAAKAQAAPTRLAHSQS